MQLIDKLEERSDSAKLVESVVKIEANCDDEGYWWFILDGAAYPITDDALDTLLNLLRIPIKYIKRCTDEDGKFLAVSSVNYWLEKFGDLSFLIRQAHGASGYVISQVFPGKRLYLPGVKVNDLIIEYLNSSVEIKSFIVEDDVFNAVYLTDEVVAGMRLGVRVLFSDCFTITPRFDGVLYDDNSGMLLCWPTLGRKFRVASNTIPQVIDQIEEFIDLSLDGLRETLVPAWTQVWDTHSELIDAEKFITRLCNDLRLSKKVRDELVEHCVKTPNYLPGELMSGIAAYTAGLEGGTNIPVGMARDIQIALSNHIVKGQFK